MTNAAKTHDFEPKETSDGSIPRGFLWILTVFLLAEGLVFAAVHALKHGDVRLLLVFGPLAGAILFIALKLKNIRDLKATDHSRTPLLHDLNFAFYRMRAKLHAHPGAALYAWGLSSALPDLAISCLEASADEGYGEAHFELGLYYKSGITGTQGRIQALQHFRKAAEQGHGEAAFHLAEMLRWREGAPCHTQEIQALYELSAQKGFSPAIRWLIHAYESGDGMAQDPEKAALYQKKLPAVEAHVRESAVLKKLRTEESPRKRFINQMGLDWDCAWSYLAESNHLAHLLVISLAGLLLVLGMIVFGWVSLVFSTPAWVWIGFLVLAALIGTPLLILHHKSHRRMNTSKRIQNLTRRADAGDTAALFEIGMEYLKGSADRPAEPAIAKRYLERSAQLGHREAMYQLGDLLSCNVAGPKQPEQSQEWFSRAAHLGHPKAIQRIHRKES